MKLIQSTQRELLNPETGELTTLESTKVFSKKISEDKFYITFIDFISPFYSLKSNNAKNLLAWMCEHAEFNTGKVFVTTNVRKEISESLGISNNAITNNLKTLKDSNLISGGQGDFIINPQIFWKGDLKLRKEILKDESIILQFGIGLNK